MRKLILGIRWPARRADGGTIVAALTLVLLMAVALFGGRVAPYEPVFFQVEHGADPRPYDPGLVFPLGSDPLGRDLFSLVLAGAGSTLTIVLLAGSARVLAGLLLAALGSIWRPVRLLTETVAELVAAVPATLVALVLIKAFVKTDTSVLALIGTLLLIGWVGPYRVIRAELSRLADAPFTEGAETLGVTRLRLFWRHQLPHLVPVIAVNLSQQIVAALVLVAELGVLGVLVGAVRALDVTESLSVVRLGPPTAALVPDAPEWGAMLASSRTVEALWTTRWLIFVPGAAFALTAVAVAFIGFALARRYARRDFFNDVRAGVAFAVVLAVLWVAAGLVPERYAAAKDWASDARTAFVADAEDPDPLALAGLPISLITQSVRAVTRSGPSVVAVGQVSLTETYPRPSGPPPNTIHVQSLITADTGSGTVTAPLVFAARGIVPSEHPPLRVYKPQPGPVPPDLGSLIKEYPDDYAGIDVRGKVVLVVRFLGVDGGPAGYVDGFAVYDSIADAIKRGAAAVLFVDPFLGSYRDAPGASASAGAANPYLTMEREFPAIGAPGVPVVVLDRVAAAQLVEPLGIDLSPLLGYDARGAVRAPSTARDLGVMARVDVPVRTDTRAVTSRLAEVPDLPRDAGRVAVWVARDLDTGKLDQRRAGALAAIARVALERQAPFLFVDFDPRGDAVGVRRALTDRRISLVLVIGDLRGTALRLETANGELIPAMDLYAEKAGTRHELTRRTTVSERMVRLAPLPGAKTIVISGNGGSGDVSADAAAFVAYLAGRLALGAPELPR